MEERGFLHVIVHTGKGLPPADFAILSKPTSDPYCVVSFGNQSYRTVTVDKDLNPSWEEHFTFRLSHAGANFVQWASGASDTMHRHSLTPERLQFAVFDSDTWKHDDLLGRHTVDVRSAVAEPNTWEKKEIQLTVAEGQKHGSHNSITISMRWEPAPPLNPYTLRILGFTCFAVAFATSFLAANCRWEPALTSEGALKQPGVGAALVMASLSLLLATLIHFVLAHVALGGLVELLEQLEMGPIPVEDDGNGEPPSIMKCFARPRHMTQYEITISPTVTANGLRVPFLLIAWVLPIGGAGLICLAMCLQVLQSWTLDIKAGQVLASAAILSVVAGYICILRAEGTRVSSVD